LKPPTTVQEFMDVCEKLKAAGKTPIALGFKDAWTAQLFMSLWIQSYGFASDPEYGKKMYDGVIKADDPAIQAVYKNLQTMKEKDYFNKNALSIDWPASAQLFASGDAGMIVQGPWMPGANKDNIEKGSYKPFQIGFFPFMDDKGNTQIPVGTNASLAINAKT
ncbi:extracellular solute-binding protein, partial [Paenibacillus sepulcri]|nr:extracellular solute-binding protein [Paenibacillus sepulcri]